MLKSCCLGFLLIPLVSSAAIAQKPVISHLYMDEPSRTLRIHGSLFGTSQGSTTVNGTLTTITSWTDTLITCLMPDSGAGYAGYVVVSRGAVKSEPHLLSALNFTFVYADTTSLTTLAQIAGATWRLRFRLDLVNDTSSLDDESHFQPSRASQATYKYYAYDDHGSSNHTLPSESVGSGNVVWQDVYHITSTGLRVLMYNFGQGYYIDLIEIDGAQIVSTYQEGNGVIVKKEYVSITPFLANSLVKSVDVRLDSLRHVAFEFVDRFPRSQEHGYPFSGHIIIQDDSSYFLPAVQLNAKMPIASTNELRIFPNPSSKQATLSIDLEEPTNVQIELFDLLGDELKEIHNGT